MVVVAVAGGLGELGGLITEALKNTGKHEVYVLSRRTPPEQPEWTSSLSGKSYNPVLETDYTSVEKLTEILTIHKIHTVVCALSMSSESASTSQLRLVQAAEDTPSVKRFLPSEFNVNYDLPDDVLPYPPKEFHIASRRALEKTSLEFSYVYPGMFMDYFGLPHVPSVLRDICFVVDPEAGRAAIAGNGDARMATCRTVDVARYLALSLDLEKWPRVLKIVTSTVSINDLVVLYEKALKRKVTVEYQPVEALKQHNGIMLPRNTKLASSFPRGSEGLKSVVCDLEASIALGAYDLDALDDSLDVIEEFKDSTEAPIKIEELINMAWILSVNMPLIDANTPPTTTDDTHYVVYFASGEPSWCPDCRDALPALNAVFGDNSAPTAHIVRVGSREEWKGNSKNKYRNAPYNIQGVPTVVKVKYGQDVGRLGDIESQNESDLRKLVKL
ncbi:hypothetical protein FSARC_9549 [Fusarium sarcochroum]|uniref:Thioredoxin domain-containing protein n=1 Tax=Fusarium sarcochroum TaxID=1208366 RepID=A0A8H4TQQ0_9HYPO|nr:hypothetical protein FSARC_9549 [Fusarium sarcochroum]